MKKYKCCFVVVVAMLFFAMLPTRVAAQESSVNAYLPYTMFGIGEINSLGNTVNRSMGGVGVAMRSSQMVNILNPAGYSATLRKSFIFDFSGEAYFLANTQNKYDGGGAKVGTAQNAKNTVNFHEIAVQFPLAKGLGMGVSVSPYSSVGYNMYTEESSEDILATIGRVLYTYTGDGDLTEVKAGIGWEIFKGFSIGVAAKYYWGNIKHNFASTVSNEYVGMDKYIAVVGVEDYKISSFKFQVGLQYSPIHNDKRILTFGATYDYGGALEHRLNRDIIIGDRYTTTVAKIGSSAMRLPHRVSAGVMYQDTKFTAGADYEYSAWSESPVKDNESIYGNLKVGCQDTHTIRVGFEFTPNRFDVRNYLRRMSYRLGGYYGDYYQTFAGQSINRWAITAGIGFPLRFMGATSIDLAFEYGQIGNMGSFMLNQRRVGMIQQQYFKLSLGLSMFGEDYWFVRPKYD